MAKTAKTASTGSVKVNASGQPVEQTTEYLDLLLNDKGKAIMGQFGQSYTPRTQEELQTIAQNQYTPVYNAEKQAAENTQKTLERNANEAYDTGALNAQSQRDTALRNAESDYATQTRNANSIYGKTQIGADNVYRQAELAYDQSANQINDTYANQLNQSTSQYARGRDTITAELLKRGMGRSSYGAALIGNNLLQEAANAGALEKSRGQALDEALAVLNAAGATRAATMSQAEIDLATALANADTQRTSAQTGANTAYDEAMRLLGQQRTTAVNDARTDYTNTINRLDADLPTNVLNYVQQLENQEYERGQAASQNGMDVLQFLLGTKANRNQYSAKKTSTKKTSTKKTSTKKSTTTTKKTASSPSASPAPTPTLADTAKKTGLKTQVHVVR